MSDEDATQETETSEVEEQNSQDEEQEPQEGDRDEAWDPERARRKISKVNSENKTLRERATAAEKKAAGAEDLSKQNTDLTAQNMRLTVGYELGLPINLAMRLQGATKEEMVADAEALVELVAPAKRPTTRKPTEAMPGSGVNSDQEPEERDLNKLGARMFQR